MMDDVLENLIQQIKCFQLDEAKTNDQDGGEFVLIHKDAAKFWSKLFIKHFLFDCRPPNVRFGDDLLFFVRKQTTRKSLIRPLTSSAPQFVTKVDVYRASSKHLPLSELDVDWEETLHLNLIMQKFEYLLIVAVCTRTDAEQVEILQKRCLPVYPSPSKRSMDSKGDAEKITYPDIYFSIDNYEELYKKMTLHDGEFLSIELVFSSISQKEKFSIFQCNLDYTTFSSITALNVPTTDNTSSKWYTGWNAPQFENLLFFKARGANRQGVAEVALLPVYKTILDQTSEHTHSSYSLDQFEWDTSIQSLKKERPDKTEPETSDCCTFCPKCTGRRMSEPSNALGDYIQGWKQRRLKKSKSVGQGQVFPSRELIDTVDIKEDLDNDPNKSVWYSPGYTHVYFDDKFLRKYTHPIFHCFPSFVSLHSSHIAQELISPNKRSYLHF